MFKKMSFSDQFYVIKRVYDFLEREKKRYILGGFFASFEIIQTLLMPVIYEQLVILVSAEASSSIHKVLLLLALLFFLAPIICLGAYWQMTAAVYATGKMRTTVFAHIQKLPVSTILEQKTGEYITILTNDVDRAAQMLRGFAITSLFRFTVLFVFSTTMLFARDWRIGFLSFIMSVATFFISIKLNPLVRSLDRYAQEQAAHSTSFLIETIKAMPIVRVFTLHDRFTKIYESMCNVIKQKRTHYRTINGLVSGLLYFFQFAAQPVAFLFGIYLVSHGELNIGSLVYLAGLTGVMAEGMNSLSTFITHIQTGLVSGQRMITLLDIPAEEERLTLVLPDYALEYALEFNNVNFAYRDGNPVLKGFSLKVIPGENIAIVGASGSGKTTLFKLLEDFYTPTSGYIRIFGRDIHTLSQADVRKQYAYVPQDAILFNGSIADNIGLGKHGVNHADIVDVAKRLQIHDFIMSFPQGYDTQVGERGMRLSGGQRQRVAIARALIKDAPILLLDEFTSALDIESEKELIKVLNILMKGRTTLFISHRMNTVRYANRIIVLDHGQLVESGSHDTLMTYGNLYAKLTTKSENEDVFS
jgi:ABC-type multidrug transport system fused ATPase/permease subunit